MFTCEIPYKDVDSSAIIWGVGNNSLHLPIPSTCPEGFKLIVKLCWSVKPRNRPSFKILLNHIEIAGPELLKKSEQEYFETQKVWREEVRSHMKQMSQNGTNIHKFEEDLIRKRTAEWKHAQDIRLIYEDKLEKTNKLFVELTDLMLYLQAREREIVKRERKYFPVRMSNTLRRIYKHNLQDYTSKKEYESNLSENKPDGSAKNELFVKLDNLKETRTSVGISTQKNSTTSVATPSPKTVTQKRNRHRRIGSDSFILPYDRRNVKMIHTESQTDAIDTFETARHELQMSQDSMSKFILKEEIIEKVQQTPDLRQISENDATENMCFDNGNVCDNITEQTSTSFCPNEQSIFDYMNRNDQLDIRESSDEESLNRRVNQFFTQNGLLQTMENGNESLIDSRLLLSIMASRRSCITVNDKDEVIVMGNSFRANSAPKIYIAGDSNRRNNMDSKKTDPNCNNDDGDDSWTDEDGEETYRKYCYLRRKRYV